MADNHFFVNVCSVSTEVNAITLGHAVIKDMQTMGRIPGYSGGKSVTVESTFATFVADMAMQSSICSHLGAAANSFCPKCEVTKGEVAVGTKRNKEKTVETRKKIALEKTVTGMKKLQTVTGIKGDENPILNLSFDPHENIPTGILHVIHLGVTKQLLSVMSKNDRKSLLQLYIKDLCPKLGNKFVDYLGSRQGKDFKSFIQIAPFAAKFSGQPQSIFKATLKLAKLHKVLCAGGPIEVPAQDYVSAALEVGSVLATPKLHALLHMAKDQDQHGPLIMLNEDKFESSHKHIREGLFKQNNLARGRDTARAQYKRLLLQHLMTGGFVPDIRNNSWRQAGDCVLQGQDALQILNGTTVKKQTFPKLTMADRDERGKLIVNNKTSTYNCIKTSDGDTIRKNEAFVANGVVKVFIRGLKSGEDETIEIREVISRGVSQTLGVDKFILGRNEKLTMPNNIKKIHTLCACDLNGCTVGTFTSTTKLEQQEVEVKNLKVKHRTSIIYINDFKAM
ncbi:unnamed protein product [Owenia fusiformis]|nr:unnamed protein product [Owenia fusiformis]